MLFSLASGALTALALVQQIDTTVPAQQGQRLVVDGYAGVLWLSYEQKLKAKQMARLMGLTQVAEAL